MIAVVVSAVPLVAVIITYIIVAKSIEKKEAESGYRDYSAPFLLLLIGMGGGLPFGLLFLVSIVMELSK